VRKLSAVRMQWKLLVLGASIAVFGLLGPASALAVYEAQDYSQAETGVVAELKAALEKFWVPLVILMAVPLGIKLFKRLVR